MGDLVYDKICESSELEKNSQGASHRSTANAVATASFFVGTSAGLAVVVLLQQTSRRPIKHFFLFPAVVGMVCALKVRDTLLKQKDPPREDLQRSQLEP